MTARSLSPAEAVSQIIGGNRSLVGLAFNTFDLAALAGKDSELARGSKRMSRIRASNPVPALSRLGNPIDEQDFPI